MNEFLALFITNDLARKLLTTLAGLLVIFLLVRLGQKLITEYVADGYSRSVLRKVLAAIGTVAGLFFALGVLSAHLGEFTVALGVAGAGIAFALQEVIGSIAGWIALSLQHFYRIGDRVQLGGIKGDVIEISILRTTLMEIGEWVNGDLYSGRIVRIANSFVFKEPVFNYSADFPFLWDEIMVPIKYGSDYGLARQIIEQALLEVTGSNIPEAEKTWGKVLRKYSVEKASVQPMITLVANDNWMAFTGRYVVNYKQRRSTKDALFTRIVELVEQTAGKVELASATFHLVDAPKLTIEMQGATPPQSRNK
jgi:small-conductance mechanosensitive channel